MTTPEPRYPDVKALTPLETQHITAVCRDNRGQYPAWEEAVHRLLHVYEAQVFHRRGATVSLAIYVSDPETPADSRPREVADPVTQAPGAGSAEPDEYAAAITDHALGCQCRACDELRDGFAKVAAAQVTRHPLGCGCTSCGDIRRSVTS